MEVKVNDMKQTVPPCSILAAAGTQEMMNDMIRAPIRNKDNERVCDVILYENTSKVAIATKEGRQTRYIDYEELKEQVESLKTTTE